MSSVLVTGGSGFVGGAVHPALARAGHIARYTSRRTGGDPPAESVGPIGPNTDWTKALEDVDAVVHLAARAHVLRESGEGAQRAFDHVNLHGTRRLAEQAAAHGVRRFVFLSTIKVNGEVTCGRPFTEADPPAPEDAYARSKAGAERALAEVSRQSLMEVIILRAPLVYGPGARANFLALLRLVATGLPLPFAGVANKRSIIFVESLADMIVQVLGQSPRPGCRTYLVSDGEDVSTAELVAYLRAGMAMPPRLVRVPPEALRAAARLVRLEWKASRLLDSLQVDSSAFQRSYAWRPVVSPREALERTGRWFMSTRHERHASII